MHKAVIVEVWGSTLGSNKQNVFFHLWLSLYYRLSIQIFIIINQFKIKSKNQFNNTKINETVKNSKFSWTDVFNKHIVTKTANHIEGDAETTKSYR